MLVTTAIRDIGLSLLILQVMSLMLYNSHFRSRIQGTVVMIVMPSRMPKTVCNESALPGLSIEARSFKDGRGLDILPIHPACEARHQVQTRHDEHSWLSAQITDIKRVIACLRCECSAEQAKCDSSIASNHAKRSVLNMSQVYNLEPPTKGKVDH